LVGVIIEKSAYKPLRNAPRLSMIISSLGISMLLANGAQVIWGVATLPVPPVIPVKVYQFGVVMTNSLQLTILIMSTMLMVALQLLVNKTKLGLAMRATSFSMDTAHVMGIDTDKVVSQTFAIGSALAAAAGIMMGIYYATIYPTMGATIGIKAFVSAVFGGIGNIPGAMLGGLLLGLVEELGSAYISSGYRDAIAFGILIIVLLIKPSGLLGSARGVDRA
jgi:branched-chain amino acid transport system permease protein